MTAWCLYLAVDACSLKRWMPFYFHVLFTEGKMSCQRGDDLVGCSRFPLMQQNFYIRTAHSILYPCTLLVM